MIRNQVKRLVAVWPPLGREERHSEYTAALVRDERLTHGDIRNGMDNLIAEFRGSTYPPNPGDVVGMAHVARQERKRDEGEKPSPADVAPWEVKLSGVGCARCRHEGHTAADRIGARVWRDGGGIVCCTEHNVSWQGRLPAERDPGPDGYVSARQMRELLAKLGPKRIDEDAPRRMKTDRGPHRAKPPQESRP